MHENWCQPIQNTKNMVLQSTTCDITLMTCNTLLRYYVVYSLEVLHITSLYSLKINKKPLKLMWDDPKYRSYSLSINNILYYINNMQ